MDRYPDEVENSPDTVFVVSGDSRSAKIRLAQLIKDLRGSSSQREFARLLGISYTTVQDWEKQVRMPSLRNIQRLSQLKGWTQAEMINYLFALGTEGSRQEPQSATNSVDSIMIQLQGLSPDQIRSLRHYLEAGLAEDSGSQAAQDLYFGQEV